MSSIDPELIFDNMKPGTEVKKATLYYKRGASDKVYQVRVVRSEVMVGQWLSYQCQTLHGRHGGKLRPGKGNDQCCPLFSAERMYDKLVRQKLAKGYREGRDCQWGEVPA